jgi:hypothetical protein
MKRFTGIEKAGLLIAALLFFGGASLIVFPRTGWVPHQASINETTSINAVDSMTAPKSRILGLISMAFGAGLAAMAVRSST